jgi:hypothetical protein
VNEFFMTTVSYRVINLLQPMMSQMFYESIVTQCDRNIAGLIQLREVMEEMYRNAAQKEAVESSGLAQD